MRWFAHKHRKKQWKNKEIQQKTTKNKWNMSWVANKKQKKKQWNNKENENKTWKYEDDEDDKDNEEDEE